MVTVNSIFDLSDLCIRRLLIILSTIELIVIKTIQLFIVLQICDEVRFYQSVLKQNLWWDQETNLGLSWCGFVDAFC